ncbi:aminoacyl-tRNA hydrolase [Candidatus Dojkabacteria bacterium]|nr:aminoacyl-tRNA hydrolase [Candidatus Dojkabacteria bacterium]
MFLVTGLGNIGKEYESTPHNAGFLFVDRLREHLLQNSKLQVSEWIDESKLFLSDICKIKKNGELIGILQKPRTFMNSSGSAVGLVIKKFEYDKYILMHDDLDIPLGEYKIQFEKSPKGHRGVLSVERVLGNQFDRVRIGIENRGRRVISGDEYVLIPYSKKELAILESVIDEGISKLITEYLQL